jgi:uncharacterized protein (TIGR03437 family)
MFVMRLSPLLLLILIPGCVFSQLIPAGQPVPKGANPPVVFLDGYQSGCTGGNDFPSNFTAADKLLQANSIVTLYFGNCTVAAQTGSQPDIETLGKAFGTYLAGLKYTDGTAVTQVDVVAHSMGGLIVRSYLAGMSDTTPRTFNPPAAPGIRKMIFLATPHFGTTIAALLGTDIQTQEMSPASSFLLALNTWNEGTDDLRGIPAISVSGNGGTGSISMAGFDDGVVVLSSSSLGFDRPGLTRVVPDCHTGNSLLIFGGLCSSSATPINRITNDTSNLVSQILVSYLTGTTAWQSVGTAAESDPLLSVTGGLNVQLRDQNDGPISISSANYATSTTPVSFKINSNAGAYLEEATANTPLKVSVTPVTGTVQTATLTPPATTVLTAIVKPGPTISPKGVICAAGPAPYPYDVAPGAYVSIYGSNLASATAGATQPYPTQIGDVQVLVDGVAQPLVFVSAGQINFVYANSNPGVTKLTVKNMNGQNTVNVRVAPAVPSIFLLDSASTAAAVNALTGSIVSASSPFHAGDVISLYVTGLGATTRTSGLDYAQIVPTVSVGGASCPVLYAGRAPSFAGLDQINCTIPSVSAGAAVPVVVTSNGRSSSTAFIPIK